MSAQINVSINYSSIWVEYILNEKCEINSDKVYF